MEYKCSRRTLIGGSLGLVASSFFIEPVTANPTGNPRNHALGLDHEHFMRLAIEQAKKVPRYPFGAVVVDVNTKKVVGEGWVRVNKNPIWHGEMTAINSCPDTDSGFDWKNVCLYTTGESCPMCQSAIIWTGMPLVVYGSSMPFLQSQDFGEINIRAKTVIEASRKGKCEIIGGVLEKECNDLFLAANKR